MSEKPPKVYTSYEIIKTKGKYKIKDEDFYGFIKNNSFFRKTDIVFDTLEEAEKYIYSLENDEDNEDFEVVKKIEFEN